MAALVSRQRSSSRLASFSVATATVLLLAWAGTPILGFSTGAVPRTKAAPRQASPLSASPGPASAAGAWATSSSSASIFAAGALAAAAATVACGARRAQLVGRAAAEIQDWSLEFLQKKHADEIKEIRRLAKDLPEDYDDIKLLRYAIQHNGNPGAAVENIKEVLAWRSGDGTKIVEAAKEAIGKATAGGGWDNAPVMAAAPHADRVSKHITPEQMVVVSTKAGDIVTCIRASTIDSEQLMKSVSEEEMSDFFIYAREINSIVADKRTRATGRVVRLIAANDLTGVSKFPDQAFQNALTGSAKRAVTLYPGLAGPTVLLNLPWLARMLVSVLTPLFPGAVREKLKFARGPMAYMKSLQDILKEPTKGTFVDDLQAVLNE